MELELSNEQLSSIVGSIITGVCVFALTDRKDVVPVYLNEGLYRMLGYSHAELDRMLKNIKLIIIPEDIPVFEDGIDEILKDNGAVEFEFRTVTGDGGIRWLQVRGNLYGKLEGYPLIAGVIIDATERKSIEEELALQAERMNILSASAREDMVDYNARTDVLSIRFSSGAFQKNEKIIRDFISAYKYKGIYPDDVGLLSEVVDAAKMNPLSDVVDFRCNLLAEGCSDYLWYRATLSSVRGADGYVSRIVGRIVNIDAEKKKEFELILKADRDGLTGLYNKDTATKLMEEALDKCAREGILAALIMIDLDHFKSVNDTFGHSVGDLVIEGAGKVLNDSFKGRDIVGRMGGDEFMVLMNDIKNADDALAIAGKLNKALTRTIEDSQGKVTVTASIGIALSTGVTGEYQSLYKKADRALYDTKENGRNGRTLYKDADQKEI